MPITSTGYRSQFTTADYVDEFGGAESFVFSWLDQEAKKNAWMKHEAASRHLSL